MFYLKLALRNLLRQKRRSVITGITMAGGFALFSISIAWADGSYKGIIEVFTENRLGHIQIHADGYLESPSIYKSVKDAYSTGSVVSEIKGVKSWTPRVFAGGLGMVGDKTTAVQIIGIDPEKEAATSNFERKMTGGAYLDNSDSKKVIIGRDLAKIISAEIGDTIIFLSQAADGSIANDQYEIKGIVTTGNPVEDRTNCYITIEDAWDLFYMHGSCHEISILAHSMNDLDKIAAEIESEIPENLETKTWIEFAAHFYKAMQADRAGDRVFRLIIMLVISVGVFNSILMSVLERTREYGLLKALGMKPSGVFKLIYAEFLLLAILSVCAGSLIAAGAISYLSVKGVVIGNGFSYGGMVFKEMKAEFNLRALLEPLFLLFISVTVVTFFPALKASKTDPSVTMRDFG